jgi:hypothetical protein
MQELSRRVVETTTLEPSIARAAIGHVLLFLRDKVPGGHVDEFIDKMKGAREDVAAALATGDGGVTQVIEGMTSFMGHGRADLNILVGKLANLGLTEAQSERLIEEVVARAKSLIGEEGVAKIRAILPALAERSGVAPPQPRATEETRPRV